MSRAPDDTYRAIGTPPQLKPARGRRQRSKLGARRGLIVMLGVVYWTIAVTKNTTGGYELAGVASAWLLIEAARPWMRSKGLPEWTASEAYITRLRRWRHSKHSQD
jgi:hypothetical protein